MMYCGLDLGSRQVKVALMDKDAENLAMKLLETFDTVSFYREHGRRINGQLQIDLQALGLPACDTIVSTGYGRNAVGLAGAEAIPELKAHVIGAVFQTGLKDFTLLDLGGQDSKVVKVQRGKMVDFQTNDKCAASTGRYLENMAAVLNVDLAELSRHFEEPVDLNSTCAIFGESELIGKITEGYSTGQLSAGVNYTIFRRIQPMLQKLASETLVFTGGVAHNKAIQQIIERETMMRVVVPQYPQFNGAIGCCVHGVGK